MEAADVLAALRATGVPLWEALLTLKEAGLGLPADFAAIPAEAICPHADSRAAVRAFDRLAVGNPAGADAAMNAWLDGRVEAKVEVPDRTWLTSLPAHLAVGELHAGGTGITHLPEGLTARSLDLSGTPLAKLPNRMRVQGCLYLRGTPLTELPEDLWVLDQLDIRNTGIRELPQGLQPLGVDFGGTPLVTVPAHPAYRSLDLAETQVTTLPYGLNVEGYLSLRGSQITTLPGGLRVGGWLILDHCPGWDGRIPEDAQVTGMVLTDRHDRDHALSLADWRKEHPCGEPTLNAPGAPDPGSYA
jgi:hypothetical protein